MRVKASDWLRQSGPVPVNALQSQEAACRGRGPYLHLEVIADVAAVEFRADQFELPVEESLCVPVLVADEVQHLLVVGHAVHACGESTVKSKVKSHLGEENMAHA